MDENATPRPAARPSAEADAVHRRTLGEVAGSLAARRPRPAVEAQREALTVWRPFEDALLSHWLRADARSAQWVADGKVLLERYSALAAAHTRCRKHLDPKSNAAVLRHALEGAVTGRPLPARTAGLLRLALASMVAKRGLPGSAEHTRLRARQARQAAQPSCHALAAVVRSRLSGLDPHGGTADVESPVAPVTEEEARTSGVPAGSVIPAAIRATVATALSAPLDRLVARGSVPSAEVLAELAPQFAAVQAGLRRTGARLRVPPSPRWLRPVAEHRRDAAARRAARAALRRLGELAVESFPGAGVPNRLVPTLSSLAERAGIPLPLTPEPFAAAYGGRVDPGVLPAVRVAAELLRGSLYERYHGIDYAALRDLAETGDTAWFEQMCASRAGFREAWLPRPGARGIWVLATVPAVIEQARVLTTFNMAALVRHAGIRPRAGWDGLARGAFTAARRRAAAEGRAGTAWRQLLFHLSLCDAGEQAAVLAWIDAETVGLPAHAAARLGPALGRLRAAAEGATSGGTPSSPRAFRP
ncbi:hypothetical protein AB0B01_21990 [Streptomyces sp. NPDC044571]|uniref:hypothetical protein n=1 Tax=Streptomyces sp. NPDC044571 TaxID=3155371 RepID=UPI0033F341F5